MKKRKCVKDNCDDDAKFCGVHYHDVERKLENRNFLLIFILMVAISASMIIFWYFNDIDEDAFCFNKLNKWFPEHKFESAYNVDNKCFGRYREIKQQTKRDGLLEVNEGSEKLKEKKYKLTDQKDIDYLESDDFSGWIGVIGFGIINLSIIMLMEVFDGD